MINALKSSPGQSLIEIVVAMGLASILLPAVFAGLIASREGKAQEAQRIEATALLKEATDAVRVVRENGWVNISNGVYRPIVLSNTWSLENAPAGETINGFTRKIEISNVYRDSNGNIATNGTQDPSTQKVTTSVSWQEPIPSQVKSTFYLARYLNNASQTESTFTTGSHNGTKRVATGDGAIELETATGTSDYGNKFLTQLTGSIVNMTTSSHRTSIRFTAQSTKTVNTIRVFLNSEQGTSPQYRYGIKNNSGGNPTGGFLASGTLTATSSGWKSITLSPPVSISSGNIYHIVVEPVGTPSTTDYIALRRSTPLNSMDPKTNAPDPSINTLVSTNSGSSWTAQNFQPIYELDFSDSTSEGNPFDTNTVSNIYASSYAGEKFTVPAGQNKNTQSVSFYLSKAGSPTNLTVELRNASGTTSLQTATIPASSVSNSFNYITVPFSYNLTAGTTYMIILRTTGGNLLNSYRIYQLVNSESPANHNSITYDGTASVFTSSSNSGSSWTDNSSHDVGGFYFTVQNPPNTQGDFTSQIFDLASIVAFNTISWTASTPAGTNVKFQVAISNTNSPSNFFGPDGSINSYFTTSIATITPLTSINGRYFRFKTFLTGNGSQTPTLTEVKINYSP